MSGIPVRISPDVTQDIPTTSTPVPPDTSRDKSPTPSVETPKSSQPSMIPKPRPTVPPKPDFNNRDVRAASEPVETPETVTGVTGASPAPGVLSGGEPVSLPPHLTTQTSSDSPMPELLSLKDRLKLFEKEIEDQHKDPEPKKDRKFSFLSQDEVDKMKEEEAKRIASMTAISMEAFESITSQISHDEEVLTKQIEALDKYDTTAPHQDTSLVTTLDTALDTVVVTVLDTSQTSTEPAEEDKREAWRQARLQSIEEDALQAQMVIDKMSDTGKDDD